MKDNRKGRFKSKARRIGRAVANPRLILCFGLAWMVTNGWSYLFVGIGTHMEIEWMARVGAAYLAFLWLPFTPEKIVTVVLSIVFLRLIFPQDEKTLAYLIRWKDHLTKRKKKEDVNEE